MQEIEVWPYEQIVYAQPRMCLEEWNAQAPQGFWDTNGSPNLGQQLKKRTCRIVDFAVLAGHKVELKENKMRDKYLDLARELKIQ